MNFDPGKFYLGVVDFFAIMLPGGVLANFIYGVAKHHVFGPVFPPIRNEAEGWVMLIFAAYLFGHFVFMIGSGLDFIYEFVGKRVWSSGWDRAYSLAKDIRAKQIPDDPESEAINPFQWAKATLLLHHPAGMAQVARYEADSKFFRSLVVVLAILAVAMFSRGQDALGWAFAALLVLSYVRYIERRFKSNQHAFWYVIAMDATKRREP